jgi:hypothetical protein
MDVGRNVLIKTGNGNDGIGVAGAEIGGWMTIDLGNAASREGLGDCLGITDAEISGKLTIRTGNGNDAIGIGAEPVLVAILRQAFDKWFDLIGNSIEGGPVHANALELFTGAGDDVAMLSDIWAARAVASMGSGDDLLAWDRIELTTALTLDGGSGTDTLRQGKAVKLPPRPIIRNWEIYEEILQEMAAPWIL